MSDSDYLANLSAEQALPHRLIRASAGSGKTYQLTQHYLDLLQRGAGVDTILATTFTRKAAGEILGRVVKTLAERAGGGEKVSSSEQRAAGALLETVSRQLHRVAISTIDSFFQRLGSSFRLELDLSPRTRLIEEGSPEAQRLRAEAIESVLADAAATDESFVALLALLRRLHHGESGRSVSAAIDQIVVNHAAVYREAPDRDTWSRLRPRGLMDDAAQRDAIEHWREMGAQLPTTKAGTPRKSWRDSWEKIGRQMVAGQWEFLADTGVLKKLLEGDESFGGAEIDAAWLEACAPLLGHVKGTLVQQIAQQTEATYELMHRFVGSYEALRRRRGVMLYSDLTHRLASGGLPAGDGPDVLREVSFRMDRAVTHLLLDEFQDTGLDQWAVLSPFAEEVSATGDGSRSLFVVGDTKQAIYGWRGGCVELFDTVEQMVPPEGRQSLARSWRSSPVVLDAVNTVFGQIASCPAVAAGPDDAAAAEAWSRGYVKHEAAQPDLPGYVSFEVSAPSEQDTPRPEQPSATLEEDDESQLAAPASPHETYVARRVRELYAAIPGRSLGVLVSTNPAVNRLLYELRRAGLPASGEGGNPISDSPSVAALLSGLQLADHPGDTAAAFHVLNSPLGAAVGMTTLGDAARVARGIRAALVTHGTAATVAGWVRAVADDCDAAGLDKLTQLVELAERYDAEPVDRLRPGRFVDFVEGTRVEDPANAAIRVMTIHKSKGLEFDAVVLPQLDRRLRSVFDVLIDRPDPTGAIEAVYRYAGKPARDAEPALAEAYAQARQRQRREDLSALYVAMTRARQALVMIAEPGQSSGGAITFAKILRDTLGAPEGGVAWGDPGWAGPPEAVAASPVTAADASALRVTLAHGHAARRMRPTVAPSSLHDADAVDAAGLLDVAATAAQRRGRELHELLEGVGYLEDYDESAAPPGLQEVLERPAVRAALTRRFGGQEELWRERRFVVPDGPRLLHGVFDRVAIQRDPAGVATAAHLIDFKTDRVAAESAVLDIRVAAYRPQLQAYRRALAGLLGLDEDRITAELVFTAPGASVEV
ncbi:MAG: UvrD-helicase domain-containing protein [Planctomycetota bacterium]